MPEVALQALQKGDAGLECSLRSLKVHEYVSLFPSVSLRN